jgi:hypothetical protein
MASAERVASVPTCGELVLEGEGLWLGHLDGLTAGLESIAMLKELRDRGAERRCGCSYN